MGGVAIGPNAVCAPVARILWGVYIMPIIEECEDSVGLKRKSIRSMVRRVNK